MKAAVTIFSLLIISSTAHSQSASGSSRVQRSELVERFSTAWGTIPSDSELGKMYDVPCASNFSELETRYKSDVIRLMTTVGVIAPNYETRFCGITRAEFDMVQRYTMDSYKSINAFLRGAPPSSEGPSQQWLEAYSQLVGMTLQKIAPYKGFIRRNIHNFPGMNQILKEGNVFTEKAFLSATAAKTKREFGSTRILMKVEKRCHPIVKFALYKDEAEVLCEAGTKFRVLLNQKISQRESFIYLEEIVP